MPVYLLLINALALVLMCLDKNFARRHIRRIPEATLLGMALFRHKTRHAKFVILGPLFLALHVFLILHFHLL